MSIFSYSRFGFSGKSAASLSTTVTVFPCSTDGSIPQAVAFPRSAYIDSVEFQLTSSGGCATVTMFLARDADGDRPITDSTTKALVVGKTTAASSGVRFPIGCDVHFDGSSVVDQIYVVARVNASTATATIRVNWIG